MKKITSGRYNERLMNESLKGNDDSLNELKFYAGSGDCEAQYFLAMYYAKACGHLHDPNYHYWLEKSQKNGYAPGVGDTRHYEGSMGAIDLTWDDIKKLYNLSHILSILSWL